MSRLRTKVAREVAALLDMPLGDLRSEWERRYGAAPRTARPTFWAGCWPGACRPMSMVGSMQLPDG